jgi:hypothetical protein
MLKHLEKEAVSSQQPAVSKKLRNCGEAGSSKDEGWG